MGFNITFKRASIKQIFTLAARDYVYDCIRDAKEAIEAETPKICVANLSGGRPAAWAINGELTESIEKKLKALPFVENVESDEEWRRKYDAPKTIGSRLQKFADRIVYGR